MKVMDPIRVIYHEAAGHGWSAESPDLPGWRVFGESYEDTHELVETGVRFTLDCNAEDRGESSADYPPIEHYVPAPA